MHGPAPGRDPAVRGESSADGNESARAPASSRPASGQPEARVPGRWPRAAARRAEPSALHRRAAARASPAPRASSNRSITACCPSRATAGPRRRAAARAGPMPSARSRSVVGQKQQVVPVRPSAAMSSAVRCVAWTAWSAGRARPAPCEQPGRVSCRRTPGTPRSRPAARTGARAAAPPRRRPATTPMLLAAARPAPSGSPRRPRIPVDGRSASSRVGPALGGAVAEAPLPCVQRRVPVRRQPAGEVAGVQQGEPDPGLRGRLPSAPRPSRSGRRTAVPPGAWCR